MIRPFSVAAMIFNRSNLILIYKSSVYLWLRYYNPFQIRQYSCTLIIECIIKIYCYNIALT